MSVSPEFFERVREAAAQPESALLSKKVRRALAGRALLMVAGPSAIGKTTVMQSVADLDNRFGLAASITTRPMRPDDPVGLFRYLTEDAQAETFLNGLRSGDIVNFALHPTQDVLYANESSDFPYDINMLATLTDAIDSLSEKGFGRNIVVGLVAPPEDWARRFDGRYGRLDESKRNRLREALKCMHDLLDRKEEVLWIVNHEGQLDDTAKHMIAAVDGSSEPDGEAVAYAYRLRHIIERRLHLGTADARHDT